MNTSQGRWGLWVPLRTVIAALIAVMFFLCSAIPQQATLTGVQCPTAPLQTISVAIRDCCGKVTGFTTRAPKPGEAGFVQCRCAEKRTSSQKATLSNKVPLMMAAEIVVPHGTSLSLARVKFCQVDHLATRSLTPLELPPM